MKIILASTIIFLCASSANADDDYSHMVYTATSFMYWCKFKEIPKNVGDFAKVTDVNDPNKWFNTVQFKIDEEKLKVIRIFDVIENGKTTTKRTSISTSNCESH